MSRKGAEFVTELGKLLQGKSVTVVEGGVAPAHALAAADNAAGSLTVKVLRARPRDNDIGLVRALDPKGLPLGEAPFAFKGNERETEATFDLPVEIRNDIARLEDRRRALVRRGATARQALAPPHDRRDHRLDRRHRAAAARLDLSISRARSTRSPTCGSPSAARPREAVRAVPRRRTCRC